MQERRSHCELCPRRHDRRSLYDAIVSGQVAAAALDVQEKNRTYKEARRTGLWNPLLDLDNVVFTVASTKKANTMYPSA